MLIYVGFFFFFISPCICSGDLWCDDFCLMFTHIYLWHDDFCLTFTYIHLKGTDLSVQTLMRTPEAVASTQRPEHIWLIPSCPSYCDIMCVTARGLIRWTSKELCKNQCHTIETDPGLDPEVWCGTGMQKKKLPVERERNRKKKWHLGHECVGL